MRNDLRYALRMLAKNPGFTAAAVLTMTLGIGLNSAVFSVVNAVLFKPLPVEAPQELMSLYSHEPEGFMSHLPMSYPDFEDLRAQTSSFSDLVAYSFTPLAVEHGGESDLVFGELVTGNYFSTLGVEPALGRAFTADDDRRGGPNPVVVLSWATWQRRFGGDPSAVGSDLRLNGRLFTVLGVAPEGFAGLTRGIAPELWMPMQCMRAFNLGIASVNLGDAQPELHRLDDRQRRWHWAMGRLAPGVTYEEARAEVETLGRRLAQEYPQTNEERNLTAVAADQVRLLPGVDTALYSASFVVMGLVGLVLLIACANLANMLLARTLARKKEVATRLALGASRGHILRQLLVESLALSLLGGGFGFAVALAAGSVLGSVELPLPVRLSLDLSPDFRLLLFTFGIAVATAVAFGLAPAREALSANLAGALHDESRGSTGGVPKRRLKNALVVAQVALSLLLLICAGLSVRSMQNAQHIDPGFEASKVATARFAPQLQGYDRTRTEDFYRRLTERLRVMPEVRSVAYASMVPLSFEVRIETVVPAERGSLSEDEWDAVDSCEVGPGYFETMGIPILSGRSFDDRDTAEATPVVVVNEALAERYWPGGDALGKRLRFVGADAEYEVVGVARTGKYRTLGEDARPYVYRALPQQWSDTQMLLVRAEGDPRAALPLIRQAARELDEKIATSGLEPLEQTISVSLLLPRMGATLFGLFGVIGLFLAAVGIYGVMAYAVGQRTHEIGIRMALGARRSEILGLVVRQGLWLVGLGSVLGLVGAMAGTRALSAVLYGISATDALTFLAVTAFLVGVAFVASWIPARRAAGIDPIEALRYE